MGTAYRDLDELSQVELLRTVALAAAPQFGLEPTGVELVLHGYNTTFRLETAQRTVALRVNTNSASSPEAVEAQQEWQHALATQTEVLVPDPVPTLRGGYLARVPSESVGREVLVTASGWLPGEDLGVVGTLEQCRALGELTAQLHDQAELWGAAVAGRLPALAEPLFGDSDVLTGACADDARLAAVVRAATARCTETFERVAAGADVLPLHADLHGGNLKWHEGRLAVFDFDDSGVGPPVLDLAISSFYLRDGDDAPERAMLEGYARRRPLPDVEPADVEALIASRQLLLANALLASTTAAFRADAAAYLQVTGDRLAHWLDTGRFTRAQPG
ncbi:Aminoglycoside phosphotransferase [Serinicoccus hydrothermalis]|uniref:Aminoglycoside phosphotransferase n=1 Tax=Serinicoccus hydrothermalis TaxID=1758689 RepID=A0A1B1NDW7_9MICO|nr:phosphotransferase [Serinicoccus hydrothermalis]ANS79581.1 Aminoglycoside phosphotransferase [Serinicoccus hydrothermalis]